MRDYSLYRRFELIKASTATIESWIDVLRETSKEQGSNYLYNSDDGSYCAIGVLFEGVFDTPLDLLDKKELPPKGKEGNELDKIFAYVGGLNDGGFPDGIDGSLGYVQLSFSEIADYLESNVDFKN